jgi:hypothetical protein
MKEKRRSMKKKKTTLPPYQLSFLHVSTVFATLISDPNFPNSHFQFAATHCISPFLQFRSIDYASFNLHFLHTQWSKIKGSCRGFIFLHCSSIIRFWFVGIWRISQSMECGLWYSWNVCGWWKNTKCIHLGLRFLLFLYMMKFLAFTLYVVQKVLIFGTYGCSGLVKYNDKGQLLEYGSGYNSPCRTQVAMYTESLLSFPGVR